MGGWCCLTKAVFVHDSELVLRLRNELGGSLTYPPHHITPQHDAVKQVDLSIQSPIRKLREKQGMFTFCNSINAST
jgi:hypothetical protein